MTPAISILAAPVLAASTFLPAPAAQQGPALAAPGLPNIVETAVAAGRFDTLVAAVTAAELDGLLSGSGPFTVFAPTDEAFAKVPADRLQYLLQPENKEKLTAVLTYHVAPGALDATQVVGSEFISTANGQRAFISTSGAPMIENAKIVFTDIQCSNGIIHVIDEVIIPELQTIPVIAANAGQFSTLLTALEITNLDGALSGPGPFTVFAPTDAAFAALPDGVLDSLIANPRALANVLAYHVTLGRLFASDVLSAGSLNMLNGDMTDVTFDGINAFIESSKIVVTDIPAANGVIHVIDAVLVP